jgi:hypothetical protein
VDWSASAHLFLAASGMAIVCRVLWGRWLLLSLALASLGSRILGLTVLQPSSLSADHWAALHGSAVVTLGMVALLHGREA